jgi:hypothetical protein
MAVNRSMRFGVTPNWTTISGEDRSAAWIPNLTRTRILAGHYAGLHSQGDPGGADTTRLVRAGLRFAGLRPVARRT